MNSSFPSSPIGLILSSDIHEQVFACSITFGESKEPLANRGVLKENLQLAGCRMRS